MLKDFVTSLLKFSGAVLLMAVVWLAGGEYQRRTFREDFDEVIQIRVRQECVRPESVQTAAQAREYDLTVQELDLVTQKLDFLNRRTNSLLDQAERLEVLRAGMVQGKFSPALGGVGGPAPTKR